MYIRTKDGVYEVDEIKPYFLDEKQKLFINNELKIAVNENQVIKQADTIEELCNRFVVIDKETKEVISIVSFLAYAKLWSSCKYNIFGAIWCEWGLKYVAKMNDKGDLELI